MTRDQRITNQTMLPLESSDWNSLTHAYGAASDMPALLRLLADRPGQAYKHDDEPWFSLWSALCHQGDVYDASYAAVPHIVHIGLVTSGDIDTGFFLLPACIEIARATGRGPAIPALLLKPYTQSLQLLHACAHAHAEDDWSSDMTQAVTTALAASKGQIPLAQALLNLDEDIIERMNLGDW